MVTIYYRERIQVKISQRKRCIDQWTKGFHLQSFPSPWDSLLPWHWYVIVHTEYCQPGKLTQGQICFEASVHRHDWLIDYPYGWTLLQVHSPRSTTLNKWLVCLTWPASIPNKDTPIRYGIGYLPEAEQKDQTPLAKAKVFTTQTRTWIFHSDT